MASTWNPTTIYNKGATVTYAGNAYISAQAYNLQHTPNTSPTWWSITSNGPPVTSITAGDGILKTGSATAPTLAVGLQSGGGVAFALNGPGQPITVTALVQAVAPVLTPPGESAGIDVQTPGGAAGGTVYLQNTGVVKLTSNDGSVVIGPKSTFGVVDLAVSAAPVAGVTKILDGGGIGVSGDGTGDVTLTAALRSVTATGTGIAASAVVGGTVTLTGSAVTSVTATGTGIAASTSGGAVTLTGSAVTDVSPGPGIQVDSVTTPAIPKISNAGVLTALAQVGGGIAVSSSGGGGTGNVTVSTFGNIISTPGTFTLSNPFYGTGTSAQLDITLVGGGGGGGSGNSNPTSNNGGGGGGSGYQVVGTFLVPSSLACSVTVGDGGAPGIPEASFSGSVGETSELRIGGEKVMEALGGEGGQERSIYQGQDGGNGFCGGGSAWGTGPDNSQIGPGQAGTGSMGAFANGQEATAIAGGKGGWNANVQSGFCSGGSGGGVQGGIGATNSSTNTGGQPGAFGGGGGGGSGGFYTDPWSGGKGGAGYCIYSFTKVG
jgi:hypothetical protein